MNYWSIMKNSYHFQSVHPRRYCRWEYGSYDALWYRGDSRWFSMSFEPTIINNPKLKHKLLSTASTSSFSQHCDNKWQHCWNIILKVEECSYNEYQYWPFINLLLFQSIYLICDIRSLVKSSHIYSVKELSTCIIYARMLIFCLLTSIHIYRRPRGSIWISCFCH